MSAAVGACVVQNNPQGRITPLTLPQTGCEECIWDHHYYSSDHKATDILGCFSDVVYEAKVLKKGILQELWISGTGEVEQLLHIPDGKPIFGSGCLNTSLTCSPQKCLKTVLFVPEVKSLGLCSHHAVLTGGVGPGSAAAGSGYSYGHGPASQEHCASLLQPAMVQQAPDFFSCGLICTHFIKIQLSSTFQKP